MPTTRDCINNAIIHSTSKKKRLQLVKFYGNIKTGNTDDGNWWQRGLFKSSQLVCLEGRKFFTWGFSSFSRRTSLPASPFFYKIIKCLKSIARNPSRRYKFWNPYANTCACSSKAPRGRKQLACGSYNSYGKKCISLLSWKRAALNQGTSFQNTRWTDFQSKPMFFKRRLLSWSCFACDLFTWLYCCAKEKRHMSHDTPNSSTLNFAVSTWNITLGVIQIQNSRSNCWVCLRNSVMYTTHQSNLKNMKNWFLKSQTLNLSSFSRYFQWKMNPVLFSMWARETGHQANQPIRNDS